MHISIGHVLRTVVFNEKDREIGKAAIVIAVSLVEEEMRRLWNGNHHRDVDKRLRALDWAKVWLKDLGDQL